MEFQYTVVGAGVVGLAVAQTLMRLKHTTDDVLLVEKEDHFGTGISSRNSEVIHSGIYYPTNSLKHQLCVEGRKLLYAYCGEHHIPHDKCGKLIVATTPDEVATLLEIQKQAKLNSVENVRFLTQKEVAEKQTGLKVFSALFAEETGIIDTHALMQQLSIDIESAGGTTIYGNAITEVQARSGGYELTLSDGTCFFSKYVINSAGLQALEVSEMLGVSPVTMHPCKGSYFFYAGQHTVKHLIYPVPERKLTGLGIHVTLDLAGRLKLGPDTEYVESVNDYDVAVSKRKVFFQAARKIIPTLECEQLIPDLAGIRPKLQGPDESEVRDYYIREEEDYPGWINLLGIESPGLTSSLAIGNYVAKDIIGLCSAV